jgi:hypothetical protein
MDTEQKIIIIFSIVLAAVLFFIIPSAEIEIIDAIYQNTETNNPNANFIRKFLYFFITPLVTVLLFFEGVVKFRKYLLGS